MDICSEAHLARSVQRRLCLSFNESMIWPRDDSERRRVDSSLWPICLDVAIPQDPTANVDLPFGHKKAKIAFDLVQSLSCLYPGPWVQHFIDSTVVKFVPYPESIETEAYGRIYLHCNLSQNWDSNNDVWKDFADSRDNTVIKPGFFLSLAELLLKIQTAGVDWPEDEARPTADLQDWRDVLSKKADMLNVYETRDFYESIRGCLEFAYDYSVARRTNKQAQAAETARNVFVKNILSNMKKHYRMFDAQLQFCRSFNSTDYSSRHAQASSSTTVENGGLSTPSFYTLFTAEDENFGDK